MLIHFSESANLAPTKWSSHILYASRTLQYASYLVWRTFRSSSPLYLKITSTIFPEDIFYNDHIKTILRGQYNICDHICQEICYENHRSSRSQSCYQDELSNNRYVNWARKPLQNNHWYSQWPRDLLQTDCLFRKRAI